MTALVCRAVLLVSRRKFVCHLGPGHELPHVGYANGRTRSWR